MRLIREINDNKCETLTESTDNGGKNYFIEGIFMQGDIKNRNGRIYSSNILEKEMHRYDDMFIKNNRATGELGHPEGPKINEDRISHLIVEMYKDGSDFYGKARILSTPMGMIVKTFIDEGVRVGVSTRGMGSIKKGYNGIMEVQNDFHLVTVDIVSDPSGPNCFVNGILENTEYYYDIASGNWVAQNIIEETINKVKKDYKSTTKKIDEKQVFDAFNRFMESIKN
jgi:hypothetical protein